MSKDRISKDPFSKRQNAFHIIKRVPPFDSNDPENGFVLGWKNWAHRNSRGNWEGWTPVKYGDKFAGENGEKLAEFISNPPMRMQGPDHVDNYVRRADTVLCYIPADWYDARQEEAAARSRERVAALGQEEGQPILPGNENVLSVGTGLQKDKSPNFGTNTAADKALAAKVRNAK